ncbi:MAG: MotA/TolQ/ExbB proton channel family protein [bacterium]
MGIVQFIKLAFIQGGFFMYAILIISIFGLAIIIERFYKVGFKFRINTEKFMGDLTEFIRKGDMKNAIELCSKSDAILPLIIKSGLLTQKKDPKRIQNAIDEAVLEHMPHISKRTDYLSMIANVSTLMGLLGTILGLIQAFHAVGYADAAQKGAMLAQGISMALNTTAFGLIVAIPCMIAYSLITAVSEQIMDEIDHFSLKVVNLLTHEH